MRGGRLRSEVQSMLDEPSVSLPDAEPVAEEPVSQRFHTRPIFRAAMLILAFASMLTLLGLFFSPRYWRF